MPLLAGPSFRPCTPIELLNTGFDAFLVTARSILATYLCGIYLSGERGTLPRPSPVVPRDGLYKPCMHPRPGLATFRSMLVPSAELLCRRILCQSQSYFPTLGADLRCAGFLFVLPFRGRLALECRSPRRRPVLFRLHFF